MTQITFQIQLLLTSSNIFILFEVIFLQKLEIIKKKHILNTLNMIQNSVCSFEPSIVEPS